MENKNGLTNYTVKYNSDPRLVTDNHKSPIVFLLDTDEKSFNEVDKAVRFLLECTSSITTVEQLVPELKQVKNFKYLLAERNITVKHQLIGNLSEKY